MEWIVEKTSTMLNSSASALDGMAQIGSKFESTLSPTAGRLFRGFFGNDVVSAGFVLMIFGSFYSVLKDYAFRLVQEIISYFYVSVEVQEDDECYTWLNDWVASQPMTTSVRYLNVKAVWDVDSASSGWWQSYDKHKQERPNLVFSPGAGIHVLYHKGHRITVSRDRQDQPGAGGDNPLAESLLSSFQKKRTLVISTFGRNSILLKAIVNDAMEEAYKKNHGKTCIFTCSRYDSYWCNAGARTPRAFHTVILAKGLKESILEDISTFQSSAAWYKERGIPYRRGYLLHGPPGTGKTSFIIALAGHLGLSVCMLSLSASGMNDQNLLELMNDAPRNAIILLEDVDAALLEKKPGEKQSGSNSVTLSGVLNALDGVATHEGTILFMTTNHIKKLPPALIRPGRCDYRVVFDYADSYQVQEMFLKFFLTQPSSSLAGKKPGTATKEEDKEKEQARREAHDAEMRSHAKKLAEMITKEDLITPAQLQEFFMLHRNSPETVLQKVDDLKQVLIKERKEMTEKKQLIREQREHKAAKEKAKKRKESAKRRKERAKKRANGEDVSSDSSSEEEALEDDGRVILSDSEFEGSANGSINSGTTVV